MKRLILLGVALAAFTFVTDSAEAGRRRCGTRPWGYRGHTHVIHHTGVGRHYGHYARWNSPRIHQRWHDTSHYDYHPGEYVPHGNHFHYQPGHWDLHRTGHWDTHIHH